MIYMKLIGLIVAICVSVVSAMIYDDDTWKEDEDNDHSDDAQ